MKVLYLNPQFSNAQEFEEGDKKYIEKHIKRKIGV